MNQSLITKARRRLLQMHFEANTGHLGGNLSCLEILMTLYHDVMRPEDLFILSKGHSAGSLYVVLWSKGLLTDEQLRSFHGEGTGLPGHVPADIHSTVPFATGSLGHGVSLGCGLALAKKLRSEPGRVYVLTSDGEYGEGSTWEGIMFAVHHRLDNLCIIVDKNGLQGFGSIKEVSMRTPIERIFDSFIGENGCLEFGSVGQFMWQSFLATQPYGDVPSILVVNTIKGHGVSFLENRMESHYEPLTREQYEQALSENPE